MQAITKTQSRVLLRAAAQFKSGEEMEEMFGVPAAVAIVHIQDLLRQRNVWTAPEQEQLLLERWTELSDELFERIQNKDDDKSMSQLISVLREVGRIVEARQKVNDSQMKEMAILQAKATMGFMATAFESAVKELSERYPEVEPHILTELFEKQISTAIL